MTVRSASCPGCGATLDFVSAATVTVVCPYCGAGAYRTDVGLESFGQTAEVVPIASPLELRRTGTFEGRAFTAVGFAQLDHGAGPWNEWVLAFDDGESGWYAEAQGDAWFTRRVAAAAVPAFDALGLEAVVPIEGHGVYRVVEKGTGTVRTFRGESPVRVIPGATFPYADLEGPGDRVGTLDYGAPDAAAGRDRGGAAGAASVSPAVYLGRRVDPSEFGLDAGAAAPVEVRATASRLSCPSCGGVVERRDPASVRVVCGSCGQILAGDDVKAKAIGVGAALASRPLIPLGSRGELRGVKAQLIAFLVRSVTVDGERYPWREYLLKTTVGAYRWLVESDGHWSLVDPVHEAVEDRPVIRLRGHTLRHFQGGKARVDHVQGEVYWQVEVGETVRVDDYVDPPFVLSVERSANERVASFGGYVPVDEVAAAFGTPRPLPTPRGVAPCQPNPFRAQTGSYWAVGLGLGLAMIVLMSIVSSAKGGDAVGYAFPAIPLLILVLLPAIVVQTKSSTFETRRWQDSDHPIGEED